MKNIFIRVFILLRGKKILTRETNAQYVTDSEAGIITLLHSLLLWLGCAFLHFGNKLTLPTHHWVKCPSRLDHQSTFRQQIFGKWALLVLGEQFLPQVYTMLMLGWWIFSLHLQRALLKHINMFHRPHVPSMPRLAAPALKQRSPSGWIIQVSVNSFTIRRVKFNPCLKLYRVGFQYNITQSLTQFLFAHLHPSHNASLPPSLKRLTLS